MSERSFKSATERLGSSVAALAFALDTATREGALAAVVHSCKLLPVSHGRRLQVPEPMRVALLRLLGRENDDTLLVNTVEACAALQIREALPRIAALLSDDTQPSWIRDTCAFAILWMPDPSLLELVRSVDAEGVLADRLRDAEAAILRLEPKIHSAEIEAWLERNVNQLPLGVRARNGLLNARVKLVRDLVQLRPIDLLEIKNFGKVSVKQIESALRTLGLELQPRHPTAEEVQRIKAAATAIRPRPHMWSDYEHRRICFACDAYSPPMSNDLYRYLRAGHNYWPSYRRVHTA